MRIKLLLMFKNEGALLKSWIKYHARLVGKDNLVIFDNGSTCADTLRVIEWAKSHSISIDSSRRSYDDFVTRGDLFKDIINQQTHRFRADVYMPVDCDEFLAVENEGRLEISRSSLRSELSKYRKVTRALAIHAGLDNVPNRPGYFAWAPLQMKKFFTAGNCFWLDEGFHYGLGMHGDDPVRTKVVYIHYHFKPYELLLRHSKEKLMPYTSDFSRQGLQTYVAERRAAYHCAERMLTSEDEYDKLFVTDTVLFPEIEAAFRSAGEPLPFDDRPFAEAPKPGWWSAMRERFRR